MTLRFAGVALLAGALLTSPPLHAAAGDGDGGVAGLMDKHRAAVGWQLGDGTYRSLRLERDYTDASGQLVVRTLQRRIGLTYRDTIENLAPRMHEERGFTGNVFWSGNWNGFITPTFGALAKFRLTYDAFVNEDFGAFQTESRGTGNVDGTPVEIVRASLRGADSADLYVDPATGSFLRVVIDPGGDYESVFHDLTYVEPLPGKKLLAGYRVEGDSGIYTFAHVEPNVPLGGADLHPPAPFSTWSFDNPKPFPISVTHERFYVDAEIDGVPGRFILDTGASLIYLTQSFAARSHLKTIATRTNPGGIGTAPVKSDVVKLDTISVGGNTLSNVYAAIDRSGFEGDSDAPDGLIGFDLFAGAIVTLDTDDATMTLADPSTPVDASNGVNVIVDLSTQQPRVPMIINRSIDVDALLDSGDPAYALVARDLVSRYRLRMLVDNTVEGYLQSHLALAGVGGAESDECGHIDSIALGPVSYENINACTSLSFTDRNVLIGFDFLKHFNMIFDYPHSKIVMIPHKEQ